MPHRLPKVVRAIGASATAPEVLEVLHQAAAPLKMLGIWSLSSGVFEPAYAREILYHRSVPAEFRRQHRLAMAKYGPSPMALASIAQPLPFTFSEAMTRLQPSGEDRWIFDLLLQYGIRDGFYCAHGHWLVVFGADRVLSGRQGLSREARMVLNASAATAVYRLKEMMARKKLSEVVILSPRETAALGHLSHGLTTVAIAARLGVSENTVKTYLKRAQKKLKAKSQPHAIMLAMRQRLI